MNMPLLQPIPSQIRSKKPLKRYAAWIFYRRRWMVMEDWTYPLPGEDKIVVIPKGFVFDGVSIPKPLHWFLSPTGLFFIPGLIHDYAYRCGYLWVIDQDGKLRKYQEGSSRHFWDRTYKQLGMDLNRMVLLNHFSHLILFVFGGYSWKKNRHKTALDLVPDLENNDDKI